MADGQVARLDGIDGGAEEAASAPVARLGDLLGTDETPGAADGGPFTVPPADLRQVGVRGGDPAAPVADFADPAPADGESPDSGRGGSAALFDSPSLGAGREDVAVAELGHGALNRSATRGGRRRAGGAERGGAERGRSRRSAGAPDRDVDRSGHREAAENPQVRSSRRRASPVEAPQPESGAPARPEPDKPRGRPRGRWGRGPEVLDPDADPVAVAREVCLRLLTDRARTRQELAQALRRKGVPDDAAHTVLERFDEVGLIDDAAFAGQWVRSRHTQRGLARRAIAMELRRKGVSNDDADEALAEVDAESEERRARELVDRKLRSLTVDTTEQQAVATRRLVGMLARKGYGAGTAYRVVKEALAERGAEVVELGDGEIPDD
jgi:regulatory protein